MPSNAWTNKLKGLNIDLGIEHNGKQNTMKFDVINTLEHLSEKYFHNQPTTPNEEEPKREKLRRYVRIQRKVNEA
jgi:hypothetical protein